MDRILKFDSVSQYNAFNNHTTLHPLVSIIDLSKAHPRQHSKMNIGLYMVFLKEVKCSDLRYGRHNYDYQEGTLVFIAPLEALIDFAHPRGLTPAQVALSWLLDKKPWIVPIPGTTKKAHLDEDLFTAELEFAHGEL